MKPTHSVLRVENLDVTGYYGFLDFEKESPQRVIIDIRAELQDEAAPRNDDIAESVDYRIIRERAIALAQSRKWDLQDSLCHAIARAFDDLPLRAIRVRTHKPDIFDDCDVGYEVTYEQD
ncbi:MAG: dihydroneopterin aldolase [Thermoplasmatota archaeon]